MLTLFMKLRAAQPDKQINCKPYIKHKICIMVVKKQGIEDQLLQELTT